MQTEVVQVFGPSYDRYSVPSCPISDINRRDLTSSLKGRLKIYRPIKKMAVFYGGTRPASETPFHTRISHSYIKSVAGRREYAAASIPRPKDLFTTRARSITFHREAEMNGTRDWSFANSFALRLSVQVWGKRRYLSFWMEWKLRLILLSACFSGVKSTVCFLQLWTKRKVNTF